jgi:hypothetical protein
VHTTSDSPNFDAVTVTVPPASAATTRTDGVTSDVTPSDELDPRSDNNATPTDSGTPGAVSSTVTDDEELVDKLPASSNKNARYEPSTRPDNGSPVLVFAFTIATEFHDVPSAPTMSTNAFTATVDFTRYTVPVSVADTVALAELFARTLVNVGAVATRSTVTDTAASANPGAVLPAASDTAPAPKVSTTVPSSHDDNVIVNNEPDDADGVNTQFVAVPVFEKSEPVSPLTEPSKPSVNVNEITRVGLTGPVNVTTVGAVLSTVTAADDAPDRFPASSITYNT